MIHRRIDDAFKQSNLQSTKRGAFPFHVQLVALRFHCMLQFGQSVWWKDKSTCVCSIVLHLKCPY